jgi:hypothetical protein
MKKIFAIVIAIAMVLSLVTVPAIAETRKVTPSTATMTLPHESTRDAANLDEALNVPGGNLVFTSEGQYPWVVDGDAAKSSNAGVSSSTSAVSTTATAAEGDIVQFDFKAWGEGSNTLYDKCEFAIDGTVVLSKGAYQNYEWEAFSTELTPGSHTLTWSYTKDSSVNPNGDYFAVDNVYVGQPAAAESINVDPVSVPAGRTARVAYEVLPAAAYDKSVTFSTADAAIATVNAAGVVTGVAEGTTTITVTSAAVPTVSGTATITVTEAVPAVNIEGFATYDLASSGLAGNWIGFADYDPSVATVLGAMEGNAWAGAFAGGSVYGYIYNEDGGNNFYIMDPETYSVSFTGTNADSVRGVIGMAYNHANQTMYGLSVNREIVTVDLATGVPTVVAPVDDENVLLLLAIDQEGNAYTITSAGNLKALDLTNGSTAVIGSTGLSANYVQSMTYDFATDMIYWAQLLDASNHGLYAINPQTAAAESLGMIGPGGVELTSMYIKNDLPIDDIEVPDVTVTFIDGIDNAVLGTQLVEAGTVLDESTFPTAPTHEGYEFTGWDYNGAPVWSDLTVKAKYRDPNATTATVVLNVPQDVWGDGSGYQMLLDADATAYGTIIPVEGALTSGGDAPAGTYDQFEYKIPVNADGSCSTQNIIVTGEIAIEIPAGTYDWCITNPTPGDRIWIASSNGNIPGRYDDFEFEGGNTYTFTVTIGGQNDQVNLEVTEGGTPVDPTPTPVDPTPTPVDPTEPPVTPEPVTPEPGEEVLVAGYYFEDGNDGWTFNGTADTNWMHSNDNPGGYDYAPFAHEGSGFIMSYSFVDYVGSFQADNWAISPAVTLPTGSARVSFYANQANVAYPEAFDVYIGTSADTSAMTLLQSNISPNSGYDDPWTQYEIDLSDYAGQTIYLAFHDHCYDAYEIWVDQVEFFGEAGGSEPITGVIGDTTLDGEVTIADAILALRHIMGLETLTGDALAQADANQDGNVTIEDCILILRAALGLIEL